MDRRQSNEHEQKASKPILLLGRVAVVGFKGNVTNATNLGIGRMHAPMRKEEDMNNRVVEGIPKQEQEGGGARSAAEEDVAEEA